MPVAVSGPALLTVRVKVIVPPTLGVGLSTVMVSDRSAEAGGGMLNSYAPMSHVGGPSPLASNGRATPRWSAAGHPVLVPASTAGGGAGGGGGGGVGAAVLRGPRDG